MARKSGTAGGHANWTAEWQNLMLSSAHQQILSAQAAQSTSSTRNSRNFEESSILNGTRTLRQRTGRRTGSEHIRIIFQPFRFRLWKAFVSWSGIRNRLDFAGRLPISSRIFVSDRGYHPQQSNAKVCLWLILRKSPTSSPFSSQACPLSLS